MLDRFIPYPMAVTLLHERLEDFTPDELAAWVFAGGKRLAAYTNVHSSHSSPKKFQFQQDRGDDHVSQLMACWFREQDVASFNPDERYITGRSLIERWENIPWIRAKAFIYAKLEEQRLDLVHPSRGVIYPVLLGGPITDDLLDTGLFLMSLVRKVEAEDLGLGLAAIGRPAAEQKKGVLAKRIWEHFDFWDERRWRELLSKPQKWLKAARHEPVIHRVAARWNPAMVVVCLLDYRQKNWHSASGNLRAHARSILSEKKLEQIILEHFPDWADELHFDLD